MRSFSHARVPAFGLLAAALLAASGCSNHDDTAAMPADAGADTAQVDASATNVPADDASSADAATDGMTGTSLTVATLEGVDGPYVADGAGNAVYFLEGDRDGSQCDAACQAVWMPVLVTAATPSGAPGLDASLVSVVTRADGSTQASYNGHPLYRYSADSGAGSVAGQGVQDKWGHWYLLTPAGEEHEGAAATAEAGTADATPDDANP